VVLLAAYSGDGREVPRSDLAPAAEALGCRLAGATPFESLQALVLECEGLDTRQEGFVVRFASGLRLKFKGAAYRRIHAILSDITPLGMWRALAAGDDLAALRGEVPEEYLVDFDAIVAILQAQTAAIEAQVEAAHATWAGNSDMELGLALGSLDPIVRRFIFGRRKRGPGWASDPGLRHSGAQMTWRLSDAGTEACATDATGGAGLRAGRDAGAKSSEPRYQTLLRHVRPDGNVLPGYSPSTLLLGAFAELG